VCIVIQELIPLAAMLELNGRLYRRSLSGVTREHAEARPSPETGHMAFIACHLLDARHFLARYLGLTLENPFGELFDAAAGIEEIAEYPALTEIVAEWSRIEEAILTRLSSLTEGEVRAASTERFPIDDQSVCGGIAFLVQHEAYHVGQLGLLRKYYAYQGVTYQ
jgi:hypothetical protein